MRYYYVHHSTSYDKGVLTDSPTQALRLLKTTHRSPKVTAMGGGHGLYGSLSARVALFNDPL